ncbi:MAG: Rieske (2Fe-2S) protein [Bacteroidia bacterium]
MDRKTFIRTCGFACLGGTALIGVLQSCVASNYIANSTYKDDRILIRKNEFLKTENEKIISREFVLVNTEKFSYPLYLYKISNDEYSALLMQCTHKGCELRPQGEVLICPCHGSEFSRQGVVLNPPADQNLLSFKTITDHEFIYIIL